jgi:ribosomal protein S18 acetylase RimI-like enzyme
MGDLQIALAGAERIDDLEPIYRALYAHHVDVSTWRPGPERGADVAWSRRRARYEKTLSSPNGILLLAERDGRLIGALIGEFEEHPEGSDTFVIPDRVGHLHDLSVLPEARGGGVGHALVERFEQELRARGAESYGLDVMAGNDSARAFYEALGFELADMVFEKSLGGGAAKRGTEE